MRETWYDTHLLQKRRSSTSLRVLLDCVCPVVLVGVPFLCVASAIAVGSVDVVVAVVFVGLLGCSSRQVQKSNSMESRFKAVLCRCDPSHVVSEIVVVAMRLFFSWETGIDVVIPYLGWSSSFPVPLVF